ncbi:MAG: DUF6340 family protein [Bacteroidota bacterium]|nr:DUF6340 family protein [Bacteroidota bacterium]
MNRLSYLIFLLPLLMGSCQTIAPYRMDILRPGYKATPIGKSGLLMVDNAGSQPADYGHICKGFVSSNLDSAISLNYHTDTLAPLILTYLSGRLAKEGYYDTITVASKRWFRPAKTGSLDFLRTEPLNNEQKNALRDSSRAPLWLSLDRLLVQTKTSNKPYSGYSLVTRDVVVRTVWRLIDARADTLCLAFQHNDTLFWDKAGEDTQMALDEMPDFSETLPEMADYVAERIAPIVGPYWETVERFYYISGSYRLKDAVDYLNKNNWDTAAEIWKQEYAKGFALGCGRFRAAMNLILYYERAGIPDLAMDWCNKAEMAYKKSILKPSTYEIHVLMAWKKALQGRVEEFKKLKIFYNGNLD